MTSGPYADQNIYVRSERAGQRVMASITNFIERRLRLKVNTSKSAVARPEERHFLGFSLRREPRDGTVAVSLSKRSKERIGVKIRELTPRNWGNTLKAFSARQNVPGCALENLTIGRSAIVRTMLPDGVVGSGGWVSPC